IPKVFNEFKIVQISDLHNRSFGIDNDILLEKIDKLKPNIICITGDLIDSTNKDFSIALKLIDELSRKYQVYNIIDNHEQKIMIKIYKEYYNDELKIINIKHIIIVDNENVIKHICNYFKNIYILIIPYKYYPNLINKNYKNKKQELNKKDIEKQLGKINNKD